MDWERNRDSWTDHDFSRFHYETGRENFRETAVVTRLEGDENTTVERLRSRNDWLQWFEKSEFLNPGQRKRGFCIILLDIAKPLFGNLRPLSSLPVPIYVFSQLVERFNIPPNITRTICREVVYFSAQCIEGCDTGDLNITATARTASLDGNDLALSCTHMVKQGLSLGIVFGCSDDSKEELIRRFDRLPPECMHPMMMPGIFFELERSKLEESVEVLLDNFALRPDGDNALNLDIGKVEMADYLKSCYKSRELENQIIALKKQLAKLGRETSKFDRSTCKKKIKLDVELGKTDSQVREELRTAGREIKVRLDDMVDILDDKINDCRLTVDNMSLTMQTVWSHLTREDSLMSLRFSRVNTDLANVNKELSEAMSRDSSQMRSIALLTMIFLPISTVASVFSSNFFSWDASPGEQVVSRFFWIFAVVSGVLTSIVVGGWVLGTRYSRIKRKRADEEARGSDMENQGVPRRSPDMSVFGAESFSFGDSKHL